MLCDVQQVLAGTQNGAVCGSSKQSIQKSLFSRALCCVTCCHLCEIPTIFLQVTKSLSWSCAEVDLKQWVGTDAPTMSFLMENPSFYVINMAGCIVIGSCLTCWQAELSKPWGLWWLWYHGDYNDPIFIACLIRIFLPFIVNVYQFPLGVIVVMLMHAGLFEILSMCMKVLYPEFCGSM